MNHVMVWFSMGGYGAYVWSTYGLVFFVLLMSLFRARRQRLRTWRLLHRWFNQRT